MHHHCTTMRHCKVPSGQVTYVHSIHKTHFDILFVAPTQSIGINTNKKFQLNTWWCVWGGGRLLCELIAPEEENYKI